jgi:hypothetical protein
MNHQRFKFYKHSTEYYRQLHNTITELEELDLTPTLTQYKSTINCNRKSKFIKSNNNTNKYHKQLGWVSWFSLSSQSVSCDALYSCGYADISC